MFQDFLHDIVLSETHSVSYAVQYLAYHTFILRKVAYTDCSTTSGILSLDPYVLRFMNGTPGEIYGNSGKWIGNDWNVRSLM